MLPRNAPTAGCWLCGMLPRMALTLPKLAEDLVCMPQQQGSSSRQTASANGQSDSARQHTSMAAAAG